MVVKAVAVSSITLHSIDENMLVNKTCYPFAFNKNEKLSECADSSRKTNMPGVMDDSRHTGEWNGINDWIVEGSPIVSQQQRLQSTQFINEVPALTPCFFQIDVTITTRQLFIVRPAVH